MDDRDRLAFYPYVVVRIRCRVCSRNGAYRLAWLAAKFGPEISLRDLADRLKIVMLTCSCLHDLTVGRPRERVLSGART